MEWRQIPGFSRYSVSNTGLVRRDVRMHKSMPGLVSISTDRRTGYPRCSITRDDGKYISPCVHQLVAAAFIGPRSPEMMVCHNDGNPANNIPGNLRYDTATGNVHDAIRHGTQVRGVKQHLAKLTDAMVAEIKLRFINEPITQVAIAREYGISRSSMSALIKGETWTHIEPAGDITFRQINPPMVGHLGKRKTSTHKGVSFASRTRKWVARGPHINGKPICLGEFKTEDEAVATVAKHLEHAGLARPLPLHRMTASGRKERLWEGS